MDNCAEVHIEIADGADQWSPPGVKHHVTYLDKDGKDRTDVKGCKQGDQIAWCTNSGTATFVWKDGKSPFGSLPPGADKLCRPYTIVVKPAERTEYKYMVALDDQNGTIYQRDPKVIIAGGSGLSGLLSVSNLLILGSLIIIGTGLLFLIKFSRNSPSSKPPSP